jgi:hypothetical protein
MVNFAPCGNSKIFNSMSTSGTLFSQCTSAVGTSDYDAQMCSIKFCKGDENLRPVYKI